jgi:hypothetical protein
MELTITNENTFIPKFRGNDKLSGTEQITVRYRTPTVAMKNRCRSKPKTKAVADKGGTITGMEIVIEKDSTQAISEMLISISNCSYRDGDKSTAITTAQDLLKAPVAFEPLLKEIGDEFDRILDSEAVDEKN